MIVRIELNQLDNRSGYYFFNDFLFNGEAYDHRDNQLYQVYEITEGVITGSRDYGFLQADGMIKVDYDLIDRGVFDYDINDFYYFYQAKLFTGLCYQYSSGFVLTEQLCIGGLFVKTIGFDPDETGRISKYEEKHFGKTDRIWSLEFANGSYKKIESLYIDYRCRGNSTSMLTLFFNERKQINQLMIEGGGNYSHASLLVPQDDLPVDFKTFDELLAKEDIFAENLSILSIDDKLLNQWLNHGLLNRVKRLEVDKIDTKPATIKKLAKLPSLDKLDYTKRSLDKIALVQAEKQRQILDKVQMRIVYCFLAIVALWLCSTFFR